MSGACCSIRLEFYILGKEDTKRQDIDITFKQVSPFMITSPV